MTMTFQKEFVMQAGIALRDEDALIRGFAVLRGEHGGILRVQNERYYQFVIWRSAMPRWPCTVEKDRHDLLVKEDDKNLYTIFELKRWMSSGGESELDGIEKDITKLKARAAKGHDAFLLIISANNRPDCAEFTTAENICWLEKRCQLKAYHKEYYRFFSYDTKNDPVEVWIAAWNVTI